METLIREFKEIKKSWHLYVYHARNAQCSLYKILLSYGDDISASCNLQSFITDMFLMILSNMFT